MNQTTTPFQYALKVSPRARRLRVMVKPYVGLEVVIPKRFPRKQIARILQQHEVWITKQLEKHAHTFEPVDLPETVTIEFSNKTLSIEYLRSSSNSFRQQGNTLSIFHQSHDDALLQLRRWLRESARKQLTPELEKIAEELQFDFKKVSIRSQKSRWGSCSSSGTISLNDQLMFMPAATMRYLMIHELCHTREMNHSVKFWKLVEQHCPDFRQHEKNLNAGKERIPAWFLASLYQ